MWSSEISNSPCEVNTKDQIRIPRDRMSHVLSKIAERDLLNIR